MLISEKFEVCESSITVHTFGTLMRPSAETPSTVNAKLAWTEPTALAEETPVTDSVEFVTRVGDPIPLAAETPLGVTVTGTRIETDPIPVAAETPVTETLTGRLTVAEPTALAAETPVTSTGIGLFHAPAFQVLQSQTVINAIRQS